MSAFAPTATPMVAGRDADPSRGFRGPGKGRDVLPTGDLATADFLDGCGHANPVPEPTADRGSAEVVSGQLAAGTDQVNGVIGQHGHEELGSDLVVDLVPNGAQTEVASRRAKYGLDFHDLEIPFDDVLRVRSIWHWTTDWVRANVAISFMALPRVRHLAYRIATQQRRVSPEIMRSARTHRQCSNLRCKRTGNRNVVPSKPTPDPGTHLRDPGATLDDHAPRVDLRPRNSRHGLEAPPVVVPWIPAHLGNDNE